MKNIALRATRESDLPQLSDLTFEVFGKRRDPELLAWLLSNRRCPEQIDSWVAELDGRVVGHTAVLKSRYLMGTRRSTGAHAYLWMVAEEHRGDAGVALARRVVTHGDFLVVLGGTPTTQAILSGRRFTVLTEALEYLIHTGDCGGSEASDLVARSSFETVDPAPGAISNVAAPEHLEWLADCPELEAHRFAFERDGRSLGPVLVYVNRTESPTAGRLVHMPYLGEDPEVWLGGLRQVGRELSALGCSAWSVLATHPALIAACEAAGGEVIGQRPVWLRERNEVLAEGPWHLTYLEGDLAYRRVESPKRTPREKSASLNRPVAAEASLPAGG